MKRNSSLHLYWMRLLNKLGLNKIKNKIKYSLLCVGLFSVLVIIPIVYQLSKEVVIENSKLMINNLTKQIGLNLDERIDALQDVSTRIVQGETVNRLLSYEKMDGLRPLDSNFSTVILQQSSLYKYTKYAFLQSERGNTFSYYKGTQKKLSPEKQNEILAYLATIVTQNHPTNWVLYEDEIYFVKKIINPDNYASRGLLCFAMTDQFFEFIGTSNEYLTNENVIILNNENVVLKNVSFTRTPEIERLFLRTGYYIYNIDLTYEGSKYLVTNLKTADNGWKFICFIPYEKLLEKFQLIVNSLGISILIVVVCSLFLTHFLSFTMTKNIRIAEEGILHYEQGDFLYKTKPAYYDEIGYLILQMNHMGLRIGNLIDMLREKERQKKEAEFQIYQAQINPHFLYNTLGSLRWASFRKQETETAENLDAVIQLLKFTIKNANQLVTVEEEIAYIKNYERIQKVRYGDTFSIRYEVDVQVLGAQIPGFILQPFVENSLLHGIDMAKTNGVIIIRILSRDNDLLLEIQDNGVGFPEEKLKEILSTERKYNGFNSIGLRMVDNRLRSYYGNAYHFQVNSKVGEGTAVSILLPVFCPNGEKEEYM